MKLFTILCLIAGLFLVIPPDLDRPFPTKRITQALERERGRPMAVDTWISGDGAYDAAGSWSNGTVVGTGDTGQFDGTSQRSVISGHTSGVTDMTNIVTTEEYGGDIGAIGSALSCTPLLRVTHRGSGLFVFTPDGGAPHVSGLTIVVDSRSEGVSMILDLTNNAALVVLKGGRLQMPAGNLSANIWVSPSPGNLAVLESTNTGTGTTFTKLVNNGGHIFGHFDGSSADVFIQASGLSAFTHLDMANSSAYIFGGTFSVGPNPSSGTQSLASLHLYGGVADFSRLTQDYTIAGLRLFGGEIIRSDHLIVTYEKDFRGNYQNF